MLKVFQAPPDVAHWIDGAVAIRLGPAPGVSCFPAMPHAMLTMRLVQQPGAAAVLCPPITFHTLATEPAVYRHAGDVTALGLLVRPAAAACLLGQAGAAFTNRVLAWNTLAGAAEAERLEDAVDRSGNDIAGFYDQSHLARDLRQLAGAPLGELISAARPDSPWWPLATRRSMHRPGGLHLAGAAA